MLMASSSKEPKKWEDNLRNLGFSHRSVKYKIEHGERVYLTSCYWSSTEMSDSTASRMCIRSGTSMAGDDFVFTSGTQKDDLDMNAVRCVKD